MGSKALFSPQIDVLRRALLQLEAEGGALEVLSSRDAWFKRTPLETACARGDAGVVKLLMRHGASACAQRGSEPTALHLAVSAAAANSAAAEVIDLLLSGVAEGGPANRAEVDAACRKALGSGVHVEGATAVYLAAHLCCSAALECLLRHGADAAAPARLTLGGAAYVDSPLDAARRAPEAANADVVRILSAAQPSAKRRRPPPPATPTPALPALVLEAPPASPLEEHLARLSPLDWEESYELDGEALSKRDALLALIERFPASSRAYSLLARDLPSLQTVCVPQLDAERLVGAPELCARALQLDDADLTALRVLVGLCPPEGLPMPFGCGRATAAQLCCEIVAVTRSEPGRRRFSRAAGAAARERRAAAGEAEPEEAIVVRAVPAAAAALAPAMAPAAPAARPVSAPVAAPVAPAPAAAPVPAAPAPAAAAPPPAPAPEPAPALPPQLPVPAPPPAAPDPDAPVAVVLTEQQLADRYRSRGLTAESLSAAGAPCDVSIAYLRACTEDFAAERTLGQRGAFGTVYRGVDATLGLRFAVKRLDPRAPWAPERSAEAEIAMLSRFRHGHIIRLWGFCSDPAAHCLVYELGVRGALSENLVDDAKARELTWKTRVRIGRGIASALSYLHRSDPPAWHRDIKAANVVLTASLTPKLIDCGLSKLLTPDEAARGAVTATGGAAFGTPGYMCPVYSKRHRYEEKAEVFSFGVLLLELLTGQLQLGGDQKGLDLVDEVVLEGELAAHRDARSGAWPLAAAEELELLAAQCVEAKPKQRPSSLAAMQRLNRLEREHCAISAEEALLKHELAAAHAALEILRVTEETAGAQQAAVELAAEAAAATEAAARAAAARACVVCLDDDVPLAEGIECSAAHFTCNDCLARTVEAQSGGLPFELVARKGQTVCSVCPADAPPFSAAAVARRIPETTFALLHAATVRATEAATAAALESDYQKRLRDMERRMGEAVSVAQLRAHVVEKILTLHCSACDQAFVDFTGCFALTCTRCNAGFCAWCLAQCGSSRAAHVHVASCQHNTMPGKGYYGTEGAFKAAQQLRRERMLREFLATQAPAIRAPLLKELGVDLRELGMDAAAFC